MKTIYQYSTIMLLLMILSSEMRAQIRFKLTKQADNKTYVASVIPDNTYSYPNNIIGTAQMTFKIHSKADFVISNLKSFNDEEKWVQNSIVKNPLLASEYDYYSYGLETMGSRNYSLVAGKETALFSFENLGNDDDGIILIDNTDIMAKSVQKTHINLGNQISILGIDGGLSNAYTGNYSGTGDSPISGKPLLIRNIFPNPATDKIAVEWINNMQANSEETEFVILDSSTGIVVKSEKISSNFHGKNKMELMINTINSGNYLLKIQNNLLSSESVHFSIFR